MQLRLTNDAARDDTPEGKFLSGLGNFNTILKSAVYLLHGQAFDKVRDFLLAHSNLVIQDDSGIPYASFGRQEWEEHLFGKYLRALPLGGLPNPPQQPLLAQKYLRGSEPLPFAYGYGVLWGKGRSNLMLFIRRSNRSSAPRYGFR